MTNTTLDVGHLLSVLPVTDIPASTEWFTTFFGTGPTNRPMETLSEWQVTSNGWVQVFHDPDRAGKGQLNLAVADLDATKAELATRGVVPSDTMEASNNVNLASFTDPDGNVITLIGGFRPNY